MKTNTSKLLITILLMGAVYASAGQPARGSQNDNRGNQKEKKETFKPEKNNHPSQNIRYKGEQRPASKELNQRDIKYRDVRRVETARNHYTRASAERVKIPQHFHGNKHYYYAPKYGHTLKYLHSAPVVYNVKGRKYYFHNDHFYRYHKGVGYVWIDNPYGMIFPRLPHGAVLVHINGRPHFRVGNLFFVHHPAGFELVTLPARFHISRPVIHISATF
jgi:hypothetical protein